MFTIYKPGYANVEGKYLESAFSNGMIKEYELPWHFNYPNIKFKVSHGVIALPKLRSKEERLHAIMSVPGIGIPTERYKEIKLLIRAYNEEAQYLDVPVRDLY